MIRLTPNLNINQTLTDSSPTISSLLNLFAFFSSRLPYCHLADRLLVSVLFYFQFFPVFNTLSCSKFADLNATCNRASRLRRLQALIYPAPSSTSSASFLCQYLTWCTSTPSRHNKVRGSLFQLLSASLGCSHYVLRSIIFHFLCVKPNLSWYSYTRYHTTLNFLWPAAMDNGVV